MGKKTTWQRDGTWHMTHGISYLYEDKRSKTGWG